MSVLVSMIGVGLVGKEVVHQLLALKHFSIHSLSNSKYTATATNATASLLDLLPASSAPLPAATAGATVELADHRKLIAALAQLVQENKKVILVDCTSDLAVTELYPTALAHGISVVTPNKKGFSSSQALYDSILAAQAAPSSGLCYLEATVGAGLPIICTLKDLLSTGDKIIKIEGVLSGTLSYIFNEFSTPAGSKVKFSEVVKIAKELGYTEPHPADDLSGSDVARKLTILSRLLASPTLPALPEGYASLPTATLIPAALENIATGEEFVKRLPEFDAEFDKMRSDAEAEGMVLRYVGVIDCVKGEVKCGLEKYAKAHPFASSLSGSDNIISFLTSRYPVRPLIVQGSGAGAAVTAMGVVADVLRIRERITGGAHL